LLISLDLNGVELLRLAESLTEFVLQSLLDLDVLIAFLLELE
jgi:hypothetical protein